MRLARPTIVKNKAMNPKEASAGVRCISNRDYYDEVYYGKKSTLIIQRGNQSKPSLYKLFQVAEFRGRFLDVGCGRGWLLKMGEESGLSAYGVDFSARALSVARQRTSAQLICCDVNNGLPYFPDDFFDYVICWGSLEHFENQLLVVREITRVCAPEGRILIQVPNDQYFLHLLGYEEDNQPVVKRYSLNSWRLLLETNGLQIISVRCKNDHLSQLSSSSSYWKHFLKLVLHPFLGLIPGRYAYCFYFLCTPATKV